MYAAADAGKHNLTAYDDAVASNEEHHQTVLRLRMKFWIDSEMIAKHKLTYLHLHFDDSVSLFK
jgi:hypothetical protein